MVKKVLKGFRFESSCPCNVSGFNRTLLPGEEIVTVDEIARVEAMPHNAVRKMFVELYVPASASTVVHEPAPTHEKEV